jgi:hypothetical protein
MKSRHALASTLVLASLAGLATQLFAFPGGTPQLVTNMSPQCANCHSSVDLDQLRDQSPDRAASLVITSRHYPALENGEHDYAKLSADDRQKLLTAVKAVDANSKVEMELSATKVKPSAKLTVTITTHGGAGPVVGVMLTDCDLRYSASPVQAGGFYISEDPAVVGPDGKPQTTFLDGRAKELGRNINYVNVAGVQSDPDAGKWPVCKVTYTLMAPAKPGVYTISAAFLYGTEKSIAIGRVEAPNGRVLPAGGGAANSGRIQFAKPVKVTVG